MPIRKNYRDLTDDERKLFLQALEHAKDNGTIDQFAQEHATHFFSGIHRTSHFLPWHREFLRRFEDVLQEVDPDIALPYWDSTSDTSPGDPLWGNDWLGPFDGEWNLGRTLGQSPALPTAQLVEQNLGMDDYGEFWSFLEQAIHNSPHNWVGGVMAGLTSPLDPVFYLHHAWIDRVWAQWQVQEGHAGPAHFSASTQGAGIDDHLHGWHTTAREVIDHHDLDYRYDFEESEPGTAGGRIMVADFTTGEPPATVRYWENWGDTPLFNGWHDDGDWIQAGDFLNLGHQQILSLDRGPLN